MFLCHPADYLHQGHMTTKSPCNQMMPQSMFTHIGICTTKSLRSRRWSRRCCWILVSYTQTTSFSSHWCYWLKKPTVGGDFALITWSWTILPLKINTWFLSLTNFWMSFMVPSIFQSWTFDQDTIKSASKSLIFTKQHFIRMMVSMSSLSCHSAWQMHHPPFKAWWMTF